MARVRLIVAVAVLVGAVGCGGNGTTPGAGSSTPPGTATSSPPPPASVHGTKDVSAMGPKVTLTITMQQIISPRANYFEPTYIKVAPGQTLTIDLANPSSGLHTFTITSPDINETVRSEANGRVSLTIPPQGDVAFFCRYHVNTTGMWGVLYLGPSPAATPTPF